MKVLRGRYNGLAELFRFSSGFGWDPETKKFTARDEVWDDYLKAHTNKNHLRDETFEDFGDLHLIFSTNVATGKNAMGLGDAIDEDAYQEDTSVQVEDDEEERAYEDTSVQEVFASLEKRRGGKLPHRKKARTAALNSTNASNEVNTEISHQIFDMIQKRWEKESEEKEAEDKANNVWEAIKEIPDLEEDLRYEAMTLIHSLGMKYGFVNMSIADRKGWIIQNLRKP
ncbi:PREDICTED: uncharacterized protein At2g29880-like [Camelina sativa]|uniref:Uncharacterized protein At2g29880-like n=1 Tax=Camelina sativa TaxID=90675 RepID=A0ABM0TCW7_CAMSA|nr:PREDICTED: uncharacterized protein At2g29880-like [Camelina sativa]XP_010490380.1 PREDICTED: uncharacterized protein At2g29880-like [Camelina sativa]